MATPFDHPKIAALIERISIPVVLVTKSTGERVKGGVREVEGVLMELSWKESIAHPDDRCEWLQPGFVQECVSAHV